MMGKPNHKRIHRTLHEMYALHMADGGECPLCAAEERARKAWDDGHIAGREKAPTTAENKALRDELEKAEAEISRLKEQIGKARKAAKAGFNPDWSGRSLAEQVLDALSTKE